MSKTTRFSSRRRHFIRLARGALPLALALGLIGPAPALAAPLDAPRAAGIVGERYDGLAVIRDESRADSNLRTLVRDINDKRRALYEQEAQKQDAPLSAVAKIYAKTIYDKAPAGWWFLGQDGTWAQK